MELQPADLNAAAANYCHQTAAPDWRGKVTPSKYKLRSEIQAEAWAKSVSDWHRLNQQSLRFHPTAPGKAGTPSFGCAPVQATAKIVQPAG